MSTLRGIHEIAAAEPERPATVFRGDVTTFTDLDAAANRFAQRFAGYGIGPGDRVAVMLTNRPELFAAWNGAARRGALVVPISYRFTASEVAYLLEDSGAKVLVHEPDGAPSEVARAAAGDVPAVTADDPAVADQLDEPPGEEYLGSPVMWMTYTSGTTGRPKGIVRPPPPPAREAAAQPFMQFWGFGRDDVHLLTGPAYHTAPGAYAQMHLVEGALVVIMERFDAEECLRLIDAHGVTNSHMVPANFVRILELPEEVRARYDLSSMRRIIHGAAPCPESVKRGIIEVFPPGVVWEYYGASEGMGTVISPEEWLERPGSVGRAFPGLEVRILDEDGQQLPSGEVGQVYLSPAPGFDVEYHNDPDKTREAWRGEHFTVGDLGWLDEDGYLYLADRRTDLILRGGVNVYPAEVEATLVEHPAVVDAVVIGLPDERLGQRVHAVVELAGGAAEDSDALRAFAGERLADFKVPATIEVVDELPREPTGKVSRSRLRDERTETST